MPFIHKMVCDLPTPQFNDLHNAPQSTDWPWKLDGVPVRREVYYLGQELRRSHAKFRFHASRAYSNYIVEVQSTDGGVKRVYSDVQVYIDGSDYVVGRIGYGTAYGVGKTDKPTYMIHSRKILNRKFKDNRDQHHMSFMEDMKKAGKLGLAKLTPYTPREMAGLSFRVFKDDLSASREKVRRSLNTLLSSLMSHNVLAVEIKGLIAQGVRFTTPEFQNVAEHLLKTEQEWNAARQKPMHGCYVYIRMVGEQQWADVIDVPDIRNVHLVDNYMHTSTPVNELPEDIQGKIAVLSMAEVGQYMQSVGRRAGDKSFWIEADV
jgi:hypothetical protein